MKTPRTRGFTLTESVVTLAVASTLLSLGVGSVSDTLHGLRLGGVSNDVVLQLQLARSEAIKRNSRMALCKSADGVRCFEEGGWEQGWILFQDSNNNGTREAQEPILQRLEPLPPQFLLKANNPLARYVSYDAMGRSLLASGAFQAGTFTLCRASAGPIEGRQIIVNSGGRPRSQKVQLENCM
jgi:type IV fimbrial biogenesis protein FimT